MTVGAYELRDPLVPGRVWRGWDHVRDREVVLSRATSNDVARGLAGLRHPNLVPVVDLVTADGATWIVEEYAGGAAPGVADDLVRDTLRGLAHAHEQGVVHGDVSSESLRIEANGVTRIGGFGGLGVSAPHLRSPESLREEPLTPASDVFAAAAVLAELLLGRPVHTGTTPAEVLASQAREPDLGGLAAALVGPFARALSPWPSHRQPDAGAFLAEIESGLAPTSAVTPTEDSLRGRRFGLLALIAVAAAAVVGGIAIWRGQDGDEPVPATTTTAAASSPAAAIETSHPAPAAVDLASYDWGSVEVPAAVCSTDPRLADLVVPLRDGRGAFEMGGDSLVTQTVSVQLPPITGPTEVGSVAVLLVRCLVNNANGTGGVGVVAFGAGAAGPELIGAANSATFGEIPHDPATPGVWLVPSDLEVADAQILAQGNFLRDDDPRCCPSGRAWTTVYVRPDRLEPSGFVTVGEPPPTLPADEPRLLRYDEDGAGQTVTEESIGALSSRPEGLADFLLVALASERETCADVTLEIHRVRSDGYASGSTYCPESGSGRMLLWAEVDGAWVVVAATGDLVECPPLRRVDFPADVFPAEAVPICASDSGTKTYPW